MSNVTQLLVAVGRGDEHASAVLLPLVYDELRKLAAAKLAQEKAGQTLQPTALVHEAYLRLVGPAEPQRWDGRGHFFAAAAEAMRRILVEQARRKGRVRHGGQLNRVDLDAVPIAAPSADDDLLDVHEALDALEQIDAEAANVVKFHFFLGLSMDESAQLLGVSPRTAYRNWSFARAWLYKHLARESS